MTLVPDPQPVILFAVETILCIPPAHVVSLRLAKGSSLVDGAIWDEAVGTSNCHVQEEVELESNK